MIRQSSNLVKRCGLTGLYLRVSTYRLLLSKACGYLTDSGMADFKGKYNNFLPFVNGRSGDIFHLLLLMKTSTHPLPFPSRVKAPVKTAKMSLPKKEKALPPPQLFTDLVSENDKTSTNSPPSLFYIHPWCILHAE